MPKTRDQQIAEDREQAEDFMHTLLGCYPGSKAEIDEDADSGFHITMPDGRRYFVVVEETA